MSTNPAKSNISVAQEIRQTDLGRFIYENRVLVVTLLILAIIGGIGTFTLRQMDLKQQRRFDARATEIRNNELEKFEKGEVDVVEFVSQVKGLLNSHQGEKYTGPFLLEVANALHSKRHYSEVINLLTGNVKNLSHSKQVYFLLNLQLAVSYEDNQNFSQAVDTLNLLAPLKIMEEKIYFDLGRLYSKLNNVEKAKASFEFVTSNYPNTEYSKLATYFLSQL